MPDPTIALAVLALVALAEASPWVRLPIGLLLAIAMLAADMELLPAALLGAAGVMLARLSLALAARRDRDRAKGPRDANVLRETMRRHISGAPAYGRTTFLLAALPGVPANLIFPLLGMMRTPLWPALAGTLVGRTPALALTAALFAWAGRLFEGSDAEAAVTLGTFAVLLLVFRSVSLVDWKHRTETGRFRMRDPDARLASIIGSGMGSGMGPGLRPQGPFAASGDSDVIEGELLGEELEDDVSDDDDPPAAIPPTGLAPS